MVRVNLVGVSVNLCGNLVQFGYYVIMVRVNLVYVGCQICSIWLLLIMVRVNLVVRGVNSGVDLVQFGCQLVSVGVNLVIMGSVWVSIWLFGVDLLNSCVVSILLWVLCGVSIWLLLVMVCVAVSVNLVC